MRISTFSGFVMQARQAQICRFIDSGAHGYERASEERGVRIHPSTSVRSASARALYRRRCVLVLDEAHTAAFSRRAHP